MSRRSIPRRAFLRGAGGLLLALPMLESLGCAQDPAQRERTGTRREADTSLQRLVMVFTPYGAIPDSFFPTGGTETSFTLPFQLEPLTPHQSDLLLVDNIDLLPFIAQGMDGVGHGAPYCYVIGGVPIFMGDDTPGPGGISVDQKIAQKIGQTTRLQSLPLCIGNSSQYLENTVSYTGQNQPLPGTRDPVDAFNKVFDGFNIPPDQLKALQAERKSVLDFVLDDYSALSTKVSGEDKKLVDYHIQSVRDLETQLANLASSTASCTVPALNDPPRDPGTWQQDCGPDFVALAKFHMDLIGLAFACAITRVATLAWQISTSFDQNLVGMDADMTDIGDSHIASHENYPNFAKIVNWYAKRHAEMIQSLKDRNVFDNTLFVWFSENGERGAHSPYRMPYVLAGSAGGVFKTGRHVTTNHRAPNDLLITIQNAFGVADTTFGDPAWCTGPIKELLV